MSNIDKLQATSSLLTDSSRDVRKLIDNVLDANSFVELDAFLAGKSFLSGEEALGEGVISGYGTIDGTPVYFFAHNAEVMKGSISTAQADKILKVIDKAIKSDTPFISIINSVGARIGEGTEVLEGYTSLVTGAMALKHSVPHIAIVDGVCVGLMSTYLSFADFVIAGNKASISFNAPTVVAAKDGKSDSCEKLFGAANQNNSLVSFTYSESAEIRGYITEIFKLYDGIAAQEGSDTPNRTTPELNEAYNARFLLQSLVDGGQYLEYNSTFGKDSICAFARINDISVGIIANDSEVAASTSLAAVSKITRFAKVLEKLDVPLITLVDSKGIDTSLACENRGASDKIATLLDAICNLNHKLAVISGNAIGIAYSAFASKAVGFDYSLAFADSVISPVDPAVAVNLFGDDIKAAPDPIAARAAIQQKYVEDSANVFVSAKDGYVDNIIEPASVRPYVSSALLMLLGL